MGQVLNCFFFFKEFVQPVCLPNKGLAPVKADKLFVAGWGRLNYSKFQIRTNDILARIFYSHSVF